MCYDVQLLFVSILHVSVEKRCWSPIKLHRQLSEMKSGSMAALICLTKALHRCWCRRKRPGFTWNEAAGRVFSKIEGACLKVISVVFGGRRQDIRAVAEMLLLTPVL